MSYVVAEHFPGQLMLSIRNSELEKETEAVILPGEFKKIDFSWQATTYQRLNSSFTFPAHHRGSIP